MSSHLGLEGPPESARIYSPNYTRNLHSDPLGLLDSHGRIRQIIQEGKFKLAAIDPVRIYNPDAEDNNKSAAEMIRQCRSLIWQTGASLMLVHHPKKPAVLQKFSLEEDPHGFMAQACGASALVKNTDFRIGLQEGGDGHLIMKCFIRMRGWGPVQHLIREFDDDDQPIGYRLGQGLDELLSKVVFWQLIQAAA